MQSDHRERLLLGVFDLVWALDAQGIRAASTYATLSGTRLPENSMLAIAQALRGEEVPNAQVYRGRLPARLWLAALAQLMLAALCLGIWAATGDLYFAYIVALAVLAIIPALALLIRRRLRYPDIIILRADGYATFFGSARVLEHPFASLSAVQVGRSRLTQGTPLVNFGIDKTVKYALWIPPCIPRHRRLATEIAAAFVQYAVHRPTPSVPPSASLPPDADELVKMLAVPDEPRQASDQ
jgi:hypothetical protein